MIELPRLVSDRAGNDRVLVALSGGLDSCVLLHAAVQALGAERVVAAHVHHHLRADADADAAHCANLAENLGVHHEVAHVHPEQSNTQADARSRRYAALARIADAQGCDTMATAHHADDVVETFLERLARGAGLSAMLGLQEEAFIQNRRVVRPFLRVARNELEAWARAHRIRHHEDTSNSDTAYRRNAIRHDVLPALTAEHGPDALRRSIENLRGEAELVSQAVEQLIMAATRPAPGLRTARLERKWLSTAAPTLRRRALIETASGCGISLHHKHFEGLEKPRSEPSKIDLPGGHAVVSQALVTFYGEPAVPPVTPRVEIDLAMSPDGALPWYDVVVIWRTETEAPHLWLPEDATIVIGGPEAGESIPTNRGDRAVRELLREADVPAEDRWRWPIVRYGDHCVSVVGVENSSARHGARGMSIEIARRARRPE